MQSKLAGLLAGLALAWGVSMPAAAVPVVFWTSMSGAAEAPPVASPATGWAKITFDLDTHSMRVEAHFEGLVGTSTVAHIHCCTASPLGGIAGVATTTPTFPGFPAGVQSGDYDTLFDMTLSSSYRPGFISANGGSPATAEAALFKGLQEGRAYFNVHSTFAPGGEIRGFLVSEPAPLVLAGLALSWVALRRRRA